MKLPEEIIIEILHRLPSKSLARFKCVCRSWARYIADSSVSYSCRSLRWKPCPPLIGFFYQDAGDRKYRPISFSFSTKGSSQTARENFDKSLSFLPGRPYIIASSKGFLLCNKTIRYQRRYYVCNPATRQWLALPNTKVSVRYVAVGFVCKVDDPSQDVSSFTVVRILIPRYRYRYEFELQSSVKIESFSSQTNAWTKITLALDIPLDIYLRTSSELRTAAGVIEGVFYWLHCGTQINVYDSVDRCFWSLDLPQLEMRNAGYHQYQYHLGVSDGILCYAMTGNLEVIIWHLKSKVRSRNALWVMKYRENVSYVYHSIVQIVGFHPADPNVVYLEVFRRIICYDLDKGIGECVHHFDGGGRYHFFPYEWQEWPRLL